MNYRGRRICNGFSGCLASAARREGAPARAGGVSPSRQRLQGHHRKVGGRKPRPPGLAGGPLPRGAASLCVPAAARLPYSWRRRQPSRRPRNVAPAK
jgi:hypothetical protein